MAPRSVSIEITPQEEGEEAPKFEDAILCEKASVSLDVVFASESGPVFSLDGELRPSDHYVATAAEAESLSVTRIVRREATIDFASPVRAAAPESSSPSPSQKSPSPQGCRVSNVGTASANGQRGASGSDMPASPPSPCRSMARSTNTSRSHAQSSLWAASSGKMSMSMSAFKDVRDALAAPAPLPLVPPSLRCPCCQQVMVDPVIASDGVTFERTCIASWFKMGSISSPLTGKPLESKVLFPNKALRDMLEDYTQLLDHIKQQHACRADIVASAETKLSQKVKQSEKQIHMMRVVMEANGITAPSLCIPGNGRAEGQPSSRASSRSTTIGTSASGSRPPSPPSPPSETTSQGSPSHPHSRGGDVEPARIVGRGVAPPPGGEPSAERADKQPAFSAGAAPRNLPPSPEFVRAMRQKERMEMRSKASWFACMCR